MIKSKLVRLRAVEKTDLAMLRDWRNLPQFRKNFREFRELNLTQQEKWFENIVVASSNDFMFLVERLKDKLPLGVCGLVHVNWISGSADLSLYIGHNQEYIDDRGYALEASKLLLNYGFNSLNLHKIWTELYEFDEKKIGFFTKKLHFKKDGELRDNCFEEGKYWNSYIFSLLKSEHKK
ncbi:MAG: GNAT family N-acetyltransferase [Candidatus Yanofskybacteria bacterium RIFOXYD1_FULL_42_10]|uniref:GNAT family N-acetyltransferase n=2 Tax=Parcubacteria group TaxID=1794811 RepID=A0A1F8HXP9_9BACT|nr:MAG: Acetyltransferase [Candidatus Jorgensenbacteria bacterium GW2011_GWF2_41_8]OGN41696.1 MAG: GNAT family N-acetyltransferase [Candidatus Yanofskybacteria bacterium RIFOXYD1_FULL_42_10]